jgi:hypothetical protein
MVKTTRLEWLGNEKQPNLGNYYERAQLREPSKVERVQTELRSVVATSLRGSNEHAFYKKENSLLVG